MQQQLLRLFGSLALQHGCSGRDSRCNPHIDTRQWTQAARPSPQCVPDVAGSFLPWVQVKQSSSVSYVMFSMRPICFLKLLALLLVVIGGLDEANLAVALQIQIILQAFITRRPPSLPHSWAWCRFCDSFCRSGMQRPHVRPVWKTLPIPVMIFAVYCRSGHCTQA